MKIYAVTAVIYVEDDSATDLKKEIEALGLANALWSKVLDSEVRSIRQASAVELKRRGLA